MTLFGANTVFTELFIRSTLTQHTMEFIHNFFYIVVNLILVFQFVKEMTKTERRQKKLRKDCDENVELTDGDTKKSVRAVNFSDGGLCVETAEFICSDIVNIGAPFHEKASVRWGRRVRHGLYHFGLMYL